MDSTEIKTPINKLFVISRYNEDMEWINKYSLNYIVLESKAGHESTLLNYIYKNYDNLPDVIGFLQAYPFDHCNEEKLKTLIENNSLTCLESYEDVPISNVHIKDIDGGYMEINNSWYIQAQKEAHGMLCKYPSFDVFMNTYFSNYERLEWVRFSPGSQYILEDFRIKAYPRDFWKRLGDEVPEYRMTEAFMIERAMWYILNHTYELKT